MVKPNVKKGDKGVMFLPKCGRNNMSFMCALTRVLEMLFMLNVVVLPVLDVVVNM